MGSKRQRKKTSTSFRRKSKLQTENKHKTVDFNDSRTQGKDDGQAAGWSLIIKQNHDNQSSSSNVNVHSVMSIQVELVRNLLAHGDAREGKWRGNRRMEWVASTIPLYLGTWSVQHYYHYCYWSSTPRLPAVDWTDAPTDLNGLARFGERRILVSARVPSRSARAILSR